MEIYTNRNPRTYTNLAQGDVIELFESQCTALKMRAWVTEATVTKIKAKSITVDIKGKSVNLRKTRYGYRHSHHGYIKIK